MAHDLVRKVRTEMLLEQPFFGQLATMLELVEDPHLPTAAVDNIRFWYNLEFFKALSPEQQRTLVAHEVLHVALGHLWRLGERHFELWNIAADYAINLILLDAGFSPIPGWLLDVNYRGMSAEAIYAKLIADNPDKTLNEICWKILTGTGNKKSKTKNKGNEMPSMNGVPTGIFKNPEAPNSEKDKNSKEGKKSGSGAKTEDRSEEYWKIVVEQAAQAAELAGNLPGNLKQLLRATHNPTVDWKEELREFIQKHWGQELAWTHPNRRYIIQGTYLPGRSPEDKVGELLILVDCSGSTMDMRNVFASEMSGILREARPEKIVVVYWDTRVTNVQTFLPDDPMDLDSKRSNGGTMIGPALQWVEDNFLEPVAAICLTDLELYDTPKETPFPMLWAVPEYCHNKTPPFGVLVAIKVPSTRNDTEEEI